MSARQSRALAKSDSEVNASPAAWLGHAASKPCAEEANLSVASLDARAKRARPVFFAESAKHFPRRALAKLKPKESLDLGPHGEAEDDEHEDEQREREREAEARELSRSLALDTKTSLRAVKAVRPLDRVGRVDRRCVGLRGGRFVRFDLCFGPGHVAEV